MIDYKKMSVSLKAENRRLKTALDRATWGSAELASTCAELRRKIREFENRQDLYAVAMSDALGAPAIASRLPLPYTVGIFKRAAAIVDQLSVSRISYMMDPLLLDLSAAVTSARKMLK